MSDSTLHEYSRRYRAELLQRLRFPFDVARPHADESPLPNERPAQTAARLSLAKANSVVHAHPGSLIIGSDQVADLNGAPIGKPGTLDGARRQLRAMRGQSLVFHSGIALLNVETGNVQSATVPTRVRFREYSDAENADPQTLVLGDLLLDSLGGNEGAATLEQLAVVVGE